MRGLYAGLPCTWLCQGLNIGLNFGIYETMNVNMLKKGETRTSFFQTFVCGSVAGIVASTTIQPLDLIRRRQQLEGLNGANGSKPWWEVGKSIVRQKGVAGLYCGLLPELCKVVPAVTANFYTYEFMRQEVFKAHVAPR